VKDCCASLVAGIFIMSRTTLGYQPNLICILVDDFGGMATCQATREEVAVHIFPGIKGVIEIQQDEGLYERGVYESQEQ
jgi:hypothetical protein